MSKNNITRLIGKLSYRLAKKEKPEPLPGKEYFNVQNIQSLYKTASTRKDIHSRNMLIRECSIATCNEYQLDNPIKAVSSFIQSNNLITAMEKPQIFCPICNRKLAAIQSSFVEDSSVLFQCPSGHALKFNYKTNEVSEREEDTIDLKIDELRKNNQLVSAWLEGPKSDVKK